MTGAFILLGASAGRGNRSHESLSFLAQGLSKKHKCSRPQRATSQSLAMACARFDPPRKLRFLLPRIGSKKHQSELMLFDRVRVGVIETPSQPWEGRILPLNHTRIFNMLSNKVRFSNSGESSSYRACTPFGYFTTRVLQNFSTQRLDEVFGRRKYLKRSCGVVPSEWVPLLRLTRLKLGRSHFTGVRHHRLCGDGELCTVVRGGGLHHQKANLAFLLFLWEKLGLPLNHTRMPLSIICFGNPTRTDSFARGPLRRSLLWCKFSLLLGWR